MSSSIPRTIFALVLIPALAALLAPLTLATGAEPPGSADRWAEVERLAAAERPHAALRIVEEIGEAAEAAGDEETRMRALLRATELRSTRYDTEGAVEAIRRSPWPEDSLHRVTYALLYAESLAAYADANSWRIGQRPTIESGGELPLERWTGTMIFEAADGAFRRVWSERAAWEDRPADALAGLVKRSDFPAGIRSTLRDTVVYLWADLLADTTSWTPEESHAVRRFDAARPALGEAGPDGAAAAPDEADAHPLIRLSALLADHEAWHEERGEPEAAFEAALVRLDHMRQAFTTPDDQETIRAELERRLDALGREHPWWSRGMAELAAWTVQRGEPGDAVLARDLAREGAEAHPGSPGARRSAAVVDSLEAPDYALSSMAADGAGERSIRVAHRNMDRLWFRAWALDLAETVERRGASGPLHDHEEVEAIVAERPPTVSWSAELAPTPDLHTHATYVTPPLDASGLYLVAASAREDFAVGTNRLEAVHLVIGDLVLLSRTVGRTVEVTALSGSTGEARAGTRLTVYSAYLPSTRPRSARGRRPLATSVADADGRAVLTVPTEQAQSFLVVGRDGEDSAILQGWLAWSGAREEETRSALLYTDRSVYRPGQRVLWKAVAFRGDSGEGRYRTRPETRLLVTLTDSQGDVVAREGVTTNDFGSASGRFDIPAGRLLGTWSIRVDAGGHPVSWARIAVEEYKRPTFEVTLDPPEEAPRLDREAELTGAVRYYFGLPVVTGGVSWRVTREPDFTWVWPPRPATPPQVVASGREELDAEGRFRVRFTPEADRADAGAEEREGVLYRYRLSVDVTDEGGETRSAERVYPIGFVAVRAKIETERGFFRAGEPVALTVTRTDLDGEPQAGRGSWRLVELLPPEPGRALLPADRPLPEAERPPEGAHVTEGDLLRPRWADDPAPGEAFALWEEGPEVAAGAEEHGADGRAEVTTGALPAGAYRLRFATEDRFGHRFETGHDLVVAAPGSTEEAGAPLLASVLLAERSSVPVGGVARLLVHSGLPGQEMVVELFRDGEVTERRRFRSDAGPALLEIPIGPELRGGFGARLTAVRDHQLLSQSVTLDVPWDDRKLEVEVTTFRDRLRPGTREEWRVRVSGADGEALETGAAEVLASMYDRSLDLFAPQIRPDVLGLFPWRAGVPSGDSSLAAADRAWLDARDWRGPRTAPLLLPARIELFGGYGIGGSGYRGSIPSARDAWAVVTQTPGVLFDRISMRAGYIAPQESVFAVDGVVITDMAAIGSSPTYYDFDQFEEAQPSPPPPPPPPGMAKAGGAIQLRTSFAETAFFEPHLRIDEEGGATFAFTVPDSVTEWRFWTEAITRDLASGSAERSARSVKELQVRPYLPRFLREGDRAEVRVVIDNSGAAAADGFLTVELFAPATGESSLEAFGLDPAEVESVPFVVPPGDSLALAFPLTVPADAAAEHGADGLAFRATVRSGELGDGEQRPLPVLPGRVRLAQSRTATLDGAETETLRFDEIAASTDPTRESERLVVTLDGQLFYGVLGALPYLVDYPYECSEQTLNRFVSTAVVSSVFDRYPAVAAMAEGLAERGTRTPAWQTDDPNRALALVETPWLADGRGGSIAGSGEGGGGAARLLRILDPEIAEAQRKAAIARLREARTPEGGYSWFPGGPPSPFMTLYLLEGFSRALEAGAEVPDDLRRPAWEYLHRFWEREWRGGRAEPRCCRESVAFLAYLLSSESATGLERGAAGAFTPAERERLLDYAFTGWRNLAPRLKLQLALALHRTGRRDDARMVLESVMDSAITTEEEGTFWAPGPRSWLWSRDTVESHAFALRALNEIAPDDPRRRGLAQWLFLDRQLGHWKSTRATAEAIYALVGYLESEGELGVREEVAVTLGPVAERFVFEPDEYTGADRRVVVPGDEVTPAMGEITVSKETPGFLFATATWWFSTEVPPASGDGDLFGVERRFFLRVSEGSGHTLKPLDEGSRIEVGDQVEVHLALRARHAAEYVHLRDPRGAGFEPETLRSGYRWDGGIGRYEEVRDSGTSFFFDRLPVGEYTLRYRLRASLAGTFRVAPATLQSMYAPEHTAYSAGAEIVIRGQSQAQVER